jgi:dihydrolipoamide dehydrogenase
MSERPKKTQIAVIGGGPGGYPAAFLAADRGLNVTLIDDEANPGGVCLYRGCIPSKALLHAARVIAEAKEASSWGIGFPDPVIDIDKLRNWKDNVVQKMTGGLGQLTKHRKIDYIKGHATFSDKNTLQIQNQNGSEMLSFDHAIIATGSRPAKLPNLSIDSRRVLDSTSGLELPDVPANMLIVGGGYIGLELGTVYAALGAKVSVVEMTSGLMPGVDRDLVLVLSKRLEKIFDSIMLDAKVVDISEEKSGMRVKLEGSNVKNNEQMFDKVLVSVGRKANSDNLGLENTRIKTDSKGFIQVDRQRRTSEPTIFAIGDVAGEPMLAHKATHEGRVAAGVIAGQNATFEPNAIPAVVFTDPEIAWCGLAEADAKSENRPVTVVRFPWGASGRATTLDRNDGVTKLIIDPDTERILGVGIVGTGAGELIAEGVLAVEMGANVSDLEMTIHPHPTLSETIMEAAEMFFGESTHVYRPKKISR